MQRAPEQVLVKNGEVVVAVTLPENPPSHVQPEGTLLPVEFVGHDTAEQDAVCQTPLEQYTMALLALKPVWHVKLIVAPAAVLSVFAGEVVPIFGVVNAVGQVVVSVTTNGRVYLHRPEAMGKIEKRDTERKETKTVCGRDMMI